MRIRTVKPEFWEDEKIACLSRDARLLYIGTFNLADDEGLLRWTPPYIKSSLFMYDDDLSVEHIKALMAELVAQGFVLAYSPQSVRGGVKQQLAWVIRFRNHQKINRPQPSKLPPPPIQTQAVKDAYGWRDDWICHLCLGPVNEVAARGGGHDMTDGWECLNASLDHLVPRSSQGHDHPTNIKLAHVGCNKLRGQRPVDDFVIPRAVIDALTAIGWLTRHEEIDSLIESVNQSVTESGTTSRSGSLLSAYGDQGREGIRDQGSGMGIGHGLALESRTAVTPCPRHPDGNLKREPCGGCAEVRKQERGLDMTAKREMDLVEKRRIGLRDKCTQCDKRGLVEVGDALARCTHPGVEP